MLNYGNSSVSQASLHFCGNKNTGEGIFFSPKPLELSEERSLSLADFLVTPFSKLFEEFQFSPESLVQPLISKIFNGEIDLFSASKEMTEMLYEVSEHPKIGEGEVLFAVVKGLAFQNMFCDGIVIVKFEQKENFLLPDFQEDGSDFEFRQGIRNTKFDKACLVLSLDAEEGYRTFAIDTASRGDDTIVWKERFLGLTPKIDKHFQTKQLINVYKDFVVEELPKQFAVTKLEQADLMNRSANYLKENETFVMNEFQTQVMTQPEVVNAFQGYVTEQATINDYEFPAEFEISSQAVKKQSKFVRSVIKLDKNFHLYVHGNKQMIEKGFDEETGMNFYKLYFKEEA